MDKKFNPYVLRKTILEMAYAGSTVHIACAFSIVEILAVLYRNFLKYPNNDPDHINRDYLILSKGHGVMAQYACMYELGWLNRSHIDQYCSNASNLKGLSDSRVRGLEVTSGSLGHGFSVGVGIAYGLKIKKSKQKVYIIIGDGELNEGPIWEGLLFASHHNLDNLVVIVDANGFQAMGRTIDILCLTSLKAKLNSFNFSTIEIDGHDEIQLNQGIMELWNARDSKPKAIIANTIKGKGIPFMENKNEWHYTRLDKENFQNAMEYLNNKIEVTE